jgi:hypothetical protein
MHLDIYSSQTTGTGSPQGMFFYFKYHITLVDGNDVSREKGWKGKWLREGELVLLDRVVLLCWTPVKPRSEWPSQTRDGGTPRFHQHQHLQSFTSSIPQLPIAIEYP